MTQYCFLLILFLPFFLSFFLPFSLMMAKKVLGAGEMMLDFREKMQNEAVRFVTYNVNFASSKFSNYKIRANNILVEPNKAPEAPSLKEIVAKETAELLERRQRLSVRDLAKKFEKGLNTATKLSNEAKWREVTNGGVLLKKLMVVLESLKGRMVGQNKDEVEEAISMVEILVDQLAESEGELLQEKSEVKKLAILLKKASEDAKKLVEEERACAHAKIESARAAVQRVLQAFHEHEKLSRSKEKQKDFQELMSEVQEARRIKMLHQPSRVMDMEHELQALRIQYAEKSMSSVQLGKELERSRTLKENKNQLYELEGLESLGSSLHIIPREDTAPDISTCSIQWYRIQPEGNKKELIPGATKSVYAPEPFDVGRFVLAEIVMGAESITVATTGPIDPAAGLGSYVEALLRKHETEFKVVVVRMNGENHVSNSIHVFHVGRLSIKLSREKTILAREFYSTSMQLCGARGGGNAAAQAIFWQAKKGLSFTLAFQSERERNAAMMLARRFAFDCNITLAGPDDRASAGT
ncbi:stomatal closure-related actin-binding protein 1-like isoform X1 [Phoenix dactylifera]|uniref:Stomatal closure-related actin-binding protein 1-like isoform X1 n=2 Tax=Phoenix dactylifera TaxID=42345 RepID=A0A8B9AXT1_PHODC|nr:stomatal closure-related actin-binding protein 1-like isoform X1 [Phoenix dactylifera]